MCGSSSAAAPVLAEVGRLQDKTRATQQEDAGRAEALVDEGQACARAWAMACVTKASVSTIQLYHKYNMAFNPPRLTGAVPAGTGRLGSVEGPSRRAQAGELTWVDPVRCSKQSIVWGTSSWNGTL